MFGWSINLFRVRGIRISLDVTFLLLLCYICYVGWSAEGIPGLVWSAATFLACFTCIVLHELGHSLTAMHYGVKIRRIVLMVFGGAAEFDQIPRVPSQEFLITIAGPTVNFVIAGILWVVLGLPKGWSVDSAEITALDLGRTLIVWNLMVGLFNLIPAFPMDGGRIVRAGLATRLSYLRATFWAASIGKVVTVVGVAVALYKSNYILAGLFIFIFRAGELEYRAIRKREEHEALWKAALLRQFPSPSVSEPGALNN